MNRSRAGRGGGFSLPEMLIVLAVSGGLLAGGVQALRALPGRVRLETAAHALAGALRFARTEALLSARPVQFCALHRRHNERHNGCRRGGTAAGAWNQGALVYADAGQGAAPGYDRREDLRDFSWPAGLQVFAGQDRYQLDADAGVSPVWPDFRLRDPASGACARVRLQPDAREPTLCFDRACAEAC